MSTNHKINVLVYSGAGTTSESVRQVLFSLRRLLSPFYSITPINADTILKEPWQASCALLVIPGGADLPYCRALNGEGNRRIQQYVRRGGSCWGFCAGGYYGSARCEFEENDPKMAVVGNRELRFFPGICRGGAFPGFAYASEAGARAAKIKVETEAFGNSNSSNRLEAGGGGEQQQEAEELPGEFISYYNGGGVFVDADELARCDADGGGGSGGNKVTVLARYLDPLNVTGGDAAIVHMQVGEGNVVLTGPHPEFAGCNLDRNAGGVEYGALVDAVTADHDKQASFLKACLIKLGLKTTHEPYMVPCLTPLHLTSVYPEDVGHLVKNLAPLITKQGEKELIVGDNDTFSLETLNSSTFSLEALSLQDSNNNSNNNDTPPPPPSSSPPPETSIGGSGVRERDRAKTKKDDQIIDYQKVIKTIYPYPSMNPSRSITPYFNHTLYYTSLHAYRSQSRLSPSQFGSFLLYGEVVTSTSTMLDKNHRLLGMLPNGLTATCTMQVAGRGRGNNAWVSPIGCLSFSTILKHPMELSVQSPPVFIQYLAALAIVEGIKSYAPGYADMPVKLKWPNDIYAEDPNPNPPADSNPGKGGGTKYVKIGGILVTSNFSAGAFHLVIGCGINTTNSLPTTSLNLLLSRLNSQRKLKNPSAPPLPSYQLERLLARILVLLEEHYYRFALLGFRPFEESYYNHWMHTDQLVRLEMEGGARARVKGITMDHGLLLAEEVTLGDGNAEQKTGRVFTLQSDGNSFDFFNGLLKIAIIAAAAAAAEDQQQHKDNGGQHDHQDLVGACARTCRWRVLESGSGPGSRFGARVLSKL